MSPDPSQSRYDLLVPEVLGPGLLLWIGTEPFAKASESFPERVGIGIGQPGCLERTFEDLTNRRRVRPVRSVEAYRTK